MQPNPHPRRGQPARGVFQFLGEPTLVFLTVCTLNRERILATDEVQQVLERIWSEQARAWKVGDFLLMPDHLHLFCAPWDYPAKHSIETWIEFWKSQASKALGWGSNRWQRLGFHHRIRDANDYQQKWTYMRANPVEAGLGATYEQWPHKGRVFRLEWFD